MTEYATLEPLTRLQTFHLREYVEGVCIARDLPCEPYNHDAYLIDGTICGLANLAAYVALIDEDQWPDEVHKWLANMTMLRESAQAEVAAEQVFPRLLRDFAPPESPTTYPALQVLPGFDLVFAADFPTHVSELGDPAAVAHLGSLTEVGQIAMTNLRRLPVPDPEFVDLEIDGAPERAAAFQFADFFAPSRLLYAAEFFGVHLARSEHGHLVAAPTRDILMALPVNPDNVLGQVNVFANTADSLYRQGPGSTSEVTYHLSPSGELSIVAYLTEPDRLYFKPNEYLAGAFFPGSDD